MSTKQKRTYDRKQLEALAAQVRTRCDTAHELILETLREAILTGILPPGERLRQEELAAVFGTSRVPLRESLRALKYEGLVDSEAHRGFTVTRLDADQIEEIYDLRAVLEGHAIHLAVPLLTQFDITELAGINREMLEAKDADTRTVKRDEFRAYLYGVTARPRLVSLIDRLRDEVTRTVRLTTAVDDGVVHHETYQEAILARDADQAAGELATHFRKVVAQLRRHFRQTTEKRKSETPVRA